MEFAAQFPTNYSPPALGGGTVDFAAFSAQTVVVHLWATWCGPCMRELDALSALNAGLPEGAVMVSVAVDDVPGRLAAVVSELGLGWAQGSDTSERIRATFGTDDVPTTLVYGRDGILLWSHSGPLTDVAAAVEAVKTHR
jgi:thiol-disulfide isomerase/thioredoxin